MLRHTKTQSRNFGSCVENKANIRHIVSQLVGAAERSIPSVLYANNSRASFCESGQLVLMFAFSPFLKFHVTPGAKDASESDIPPTLDRGGIFGIQIPFAPTFHNRAF